MTIAKIAFTSIGPVPTPAIASPAAATVEKPNGPLCGLICAVRKQETRFVRVCITQ